MHKLSKRILSAVMALTCAVALFPVNLPVVEAASTTSAATVYIRNEYAGNTFNLDRNASDTNVQIWSKGTNANQKWTFIEAGDGYYFIMCNTGHYLDVQNGNKNNLANVWTYALNRSDAQKWQLVPSPKCQGYFQIRSKLNGKCLTLDWINGIKNGANVMMYSEADTPIQCWKLVEVETNQPITSVDNGKFSISRTVKIKNDYSRADMSSPTTKVPIGYGDGPRWRIERASGPYCYLYNTSSKKYLTMDKNGNVTEQATASNNAQFKFVPCSDGVNATEYFLIVSVHGLCLYNVLTAMPYGKGSISAGILGSASYRNTQNSRWFVC